MGNIKKACGTCGSANVRRDASVEWNVAQQCWQIVSIYDNADCEDCGGETTIKDEPIAGDEAKVVEPEVGSTAYTVNKVRGAHGMLREAAKMCRLDAAVGHAQMCDRHASELEGILPAEGMRYFSVRGYLPSYDEDSYDEPDTLQFQARNREHAVTLFEESMWTAAKARGDVPGTEPGHCVINSVVVSDTAIADAPRAPVPDAFPNIPF